MAQIKEVSATYAYTATPQLLTTVTERGQTTIPRQLRQRYGVRAKTRLCWIDTGQGMLVVPVSDNPIKTARGMLAGKRTSAQTFIATKEEEIQLEESGP